MTSEQWYSLPESERAWREAEWEIKQDTCPHCGRLRSTCSDAEREWFVQRTICYATREREAVERLHSLVRKDRPYHNGDETEWVKEADEAHPYHYRDGVTYWAAETEVNPEDQFLGDPLEAAAVALFQGTGDA